MNPHFFSSPSEFRKWLENNHHKAKELLVGFYKVSTAKPSMTWSQSVDEALCFGWIDGVRKSLDNDSYCIRFTPRKPSSNWSAINIQKVETLTKQGLMQPAGLASFEKRKEDKSAIYSYENKPENLSDAFEQQFKTHPEAWSFFTGQAPSYQKTAIYWVMSAKQENTRISRLEKLIKSCEAGLKLF